MSRSGLGRILTNTIVNNFYSIANYWNKNCFTIYREKCISRGTS